MIVTVKNTRGDTQTIEITDDMTVAQMAELTMEKFNVDKTQYSTVKLILKGKVLSNETKVINADGINSNMAFIMLPEKKKQETNQSTVPKQDYKVTPPENQNDTYNQQQSYMASLVFLSILRNHPTFSYLLFAEKDTFFDVIANNKGFKDMHKKLLVNSDKYIELMKAGKPITLEDIDTQISLPLNGNQIPSIITKQTSQNNQKEQVEVNIQEEVNKFTQEDYINIEQLVSMGFKKDKAVVAYIITGKNIELAASILTEE